MLSRLFKLSLESLRGYMAAREVSLGADLTTFVDVVASQRYAQCRELATLLGYLDSSPDTLPRDVTRMKRMWTGAADDLRQENVRHFLQAVVKAEQRLEDALLLAARQAETEAVKNCLHAFAINICSVQDRLDEMLSDSLAE